MSCDLPVTEAQSGDQCHVICLSQRLSWVLRKISIGVVNSPAKTAPREVFVLFVGQFAADADHAGSGAGRVAHQDRYLALLPAGRVRLAVCLWRRLFEAGRFLLHVVFLRVPVWNSRLHSSGRGLLPPRLFPTCHRLSDRVGHLGRSVDVAVGGQVPFNERGDALHNGCNGKLV